MKFEKNIEVSDGVYHMDINIRQWQKEGTVGGFQTGCIIINLENPLFE